MNEWITEGFKPILIWKLLYSNHLFNSIATVASMVKNCTLMNQMFF